ncbi:MAG: hypothetical protein JWP69_1359 [Flaviaesturariibacter sp.]|nr:hypothetical protein [Flaviaesturariibacter sp.]
MSHSSLQQHSNELISEEVREIIGYRPHWIVRRGNTVFFGVLFCLLAATWFIRYPDRVEGSARLVAVNAPKMLTATAEGKLEKLLVRNEQGVKKGDMLAYLQSTASAGEVLRLRTWVGARLLALEEGGFQVLHKDPLPAFTQLGELQQPYQEFGLVSTETAQLLGSGYYQKKKAALLKDMAFLAALKTNTVAQKSLMAEDRGLQQKEFEAYEALARDKVIAPLELNQYKSRLLAKDQGLDQVDAQLTNSAIATHNKQKELADLQKFTFDQQQKYLASLLTLKSAIDAWMQRYIVQAPEEGTVYFVGSLQENQLLTIGQELFYIQSQRSGYYGELMIGQAGLGKVRKGQTVLLKAPSYPSEEWGHIKGRIAAIANLSNRRDSFLVTLELTEGLRTSYGKELYFRNGLAAQGSVITDDRRLLQRLLGQLKGVWER